jgi:hypothetical protein
MLARNDVTIISLSRIVRKYINMLQVTNVVACARETGQKESIWNDRFSKTANPTTGNHPIMCTIFPQAFPFRYLKWRWTFAICPSHPSGSSRCIICREAHQPESCTSTKPEHQLQNYLLHLKTAMIIASYESFSDAAITWQSSHFKRRSTD